MDQTERDDSLLLSLIRHQLNSKECALITPLDADQSWLDVQTELQ